jgi:hypothetical protein
MAKAKEGPCPLCRALATEPAIYEDPQVKVLRTKNLKGHKERVMVVSKAHSVPRSERAALDRRMVKVLHRLGPKLFAYTYKFAVLSPKFASVPAHPHFVASDLEPGEDLHQLLGTPWMEVVDVRLWKRSDPA